jgi:hypothetical protein
MKIIAAYPTIEQAYLAAARLGSAGIRADIRDEAIATLNWLYSSAIGGVKLAVGEADVADAEEILREPAQEEGILVCPHCGSRDVTVRTLSAAGGVLIVLNIPLPLAFQTADCRGCGKSHGISAHPNLE